MQQELAYFKKGEILCLWLSQRINLNFTSESALGSRNQRDDHTLIISGSSLEVIF